MKSMNIKENIEKLTKYLNELKVPIALLITAFFTARILYKIGISNNPRGIWEDVIYLLAAVSAVVLLPSIISVIIETFS